MIGVLQRYARWLHLKWPAGRVEKLPEARADGSTNVPGLYVAGDITGIPLLKFSSDSGARVVRTIVGDRAFANRKPRDDALDLVIIGAGVSGVAAAMEARTHGLSFAVLEAGEPLATIVNFPKGKPIFTYPTGMKPAGDLQFTDRSAVKEGLLDELRDYMAAHDITPVPARAERVRSSGGLLEVEVGAGRSYRAHRVLVAIGRSGNFRRLGVPGEDLDKVYNRLHDPRDFCDRRVLVVGGGDSALETAIALARCGAAVTISYRKPEFSRPKPDNVEALRELAGSIRLALPSTIGEIRADEVVLTDAAGRTETLPNDVVFTMIGREAPLDFFRRSGVRIRGEWRAASMVGLVLFVLFCFWLYHWKAEKPVPGLGALPGWLDPDPARLWGMVQSLGGAVAQWAGDPATLLGTLRISSSGPSFYYTLAYSVLVVTFGIRRIRRRRAPYVVLQTYTLMAIQCLPLFLLPEIILPWLGHNGWFDGGLLGWVADQLVPIPEGHYGHGREYWRAYGLILAWPLFVYNVFTDAPLWGWLIVGSFQTFVVIPLLIRRWGKGAYCGWICSCGALAETLGDAHRHKMPHGPVWNRLNLVGQVILGVAAILLVLRVTGWIWDGSWADRLFAAAFGGLHGLNYAWFVDLMLAGVLGYGLYFWYSGRVWCRFACPLAALMHIYARWTRFRIIADKKRCISCNVCTAVCHQGIDVMSFANKGRPMEDPQCVRCSACVQSCPTGVLQFGRVDPKTGAVVARDRLDASPVLMAEKGP